MSFIERTTKCHFRVVNPLNMYMTLKLEIPTTETEAKTKPHKNKN